MRIFQSKHGDYAWIDGEELTNIVNSEIWQIEVLCQILGLNIHLPDLDDYELSGKAAVMERMELYYDAVRQIHHQQD